MTQSAHARGHPGVQALCTCEHLQGRCGLNLTLCCWCPAHSKPCCGDSVNPAGENLLSARGNPFVCCFYLLLQLSCEIGIITPFLMFLVLRFEFKAYTALSHSTSPFFL
jgi:hypothetical protein